MKRVMIELLNMTKEELDISAYDVSGQRVKGGLQSVPRGGPWQKGKQCFLKDSRRWEVMSPKCDHFHGKLQISFITEGGLAVKYTREGEGHADESLVIDMHVVSKMCTAFDDTLFETMVKSS